ncbi:MAG: bis(5'-nucleosyl)-tetraphosphatase (symmetrical) YqeK [Selenomonadaceae bacterium]|nr:bis(5'-nucleosyl)-tetraphosphatase (symmetrical) YqeK [Selenomonadaceae bacterium]
MDYKQMREQLKSRLKPSRFLHSEGVAETAAFLGERFQLDIEQCRVAGLLHDCARQYSDKQLQAEADRRGISYGDVDKAMPLLLHAYIGASLVKEDYGVTDQAICQAIFRHTVGGAGMTELDKVIYFADMIEPNRDYPQVEELRRLSRLASLDEMFFAGLVQSLNFVLKKGSLVHPDTVTAYNEILLKRAELNG